MFRRTWKPLATTVLGIGGPAYLYYTYSKQKLQTFNMVVRDRGPDGQRILSTRSFTLLSPEEVDARLNKDATLKTTRRPGGIVWHRTTASLSSNDPIEDASANAIVERDASDHSPQGDLLFFAVMDGHSGPHTSRLLSQVLLPAVGTEISSLIKEPYLIFPKPSLLHKIKSLFWSSPAGSGSLDADPKYFSLAIQSAFSRLDSELTNAPLRLLKAELDARKSSKGTTLDLSDHPMARETMSTALSGTSYLRVT
jgi:pyruvate dehydrogenase phosphatase